VRIAGDVTYMGMMNESQENHGLDWEGVGSGAARYTSVQYFHDPRTKETKK
jgi:hypothetical protein